MTKVNREPFRRGSYKIDYEEPIEGFSIEDGSVVYMKFDPNDTSGQDESAQLIIDSARNKKERRILQELVDQQLGRKPIKAIPELGETEK